MKVDSELADGRFGSKRGLKYKQNKKQCQKV
jgi:hypothetical protein